MTPATRTPLDLSSMVARLVLALLVAATVTLLGLWLRASSALDFASTTIAVTVSTYAAAKLRGERKGPPRAAVVRLQPLLDVLATWPVGRAVVKPGCKRFCRALGVGLVTAILESMLVRGPLAGIHTSDIVEHSIAVILVVFPLQAFLAWWRSRLTFEGSRFQHELADALRRVARPEGSAGVERKLISPRAMIALTAGGHTTASVLVRVVVQLGIPAIFSTPISIAAVALAVVTGIAGGPVWAALGRIVKASPAPEPARATATEGDNDGR